MSINRREFVWLVRKFQIEYRSNDLSQFAGWVLRNDREEQELREAIEKVWERI